MGREKGATWAKEKANMWQLHLAAGLKRLRKRKDGGWKVKSKLEFTLFRQPDADDLAKLFEQQIGRDVSEEEKQEMVKILSGKKSG